MCFKYLLFKVFIKGSIRRGVLAREVKFGERKDISYSENCALNSEANILNAKT